MASSFEFVQGNERLDWGVLVSIDVHRLMKDTNVDTLQRIVENLAFSRITRDEAALFTPDHILQLFQLSQLVVQYLVYSQECLAKMNMKLNERLEDLQGSQRGSESAIQTLTEENASLKKEVKAQRRTLLAYEYNAAAGIRPGGGAATNAGPSGEFVCSLCGEAYHKQESLQSHMRKRHYGIPQPPPAAAPGYYPSSTAAAAASQPPPLPPRPNTMQGGGGGGAGDDLSRVSARVQQLEAKIERDRDAMDRQRDNLMMLLLAKNGQAAPVPASVNYTPTPQPQPQVQLPAGDVAMGSPAFQSPVRAPSGASLLPNAISAIPIVPDTAAMMAYNQSNQREAADNALARQIRDLEKEMRDLRSSATHTMSPIQPAGGAPTETPAVADGTSLPGATPSWLSSMGLPSVPASTPVPWVGDGLANANTNNASSAVQPPSVQGVIGQSPSHAVPPPPLPTLGGPSQANDAQRQQDMANYLKYGPSGPAFVPPPAPPSGTIIPNPSTALPPPPPQLNTPHPHRRQLSSSSSYSYSYSSSRSSSSSSDSLLARAYRASATTNWSSGQQHKSSSRRRHRGDRGDGTSRTASPPAPPPVPVLSAGAVPVMAAPQPPPLPMTAYEIQHVPVPSADPKHDKKSKKDKKDRKSRHKAKEEKVDVPVNTLLSPPELEKPLGVPSSTNPSNAPLSYAAILQQYQDQLMKPVSATPVPVPSAMPGSGPAPLLSTVGSPPLAVPSAGAAPLNAIPPLPVPGVGYNYGVSTPASNTYSTSATLPPPPPPSSATAAAAPKSNIPAWLRQQDSRASSSGSTSSTSTVPPNRIPPASLPTSTPGQDQGGPLSVPSLSVSTVNTIPVPSAYGVQRPPVSTYSGQSSGPLGVPTVGAVPVPVPLAPSGSTPTASVVPSPYANTAYMTGVAPTVTPIPVPSSMNTVNSIPVPSPYATASTPLPNYGYTPSQPNNYTSGVAEVKPFRPRVASSDSSSGYSY